MGNKWWVLIFGIVVRTGVGGGIDGSRLHWGQDSESNIQRSVQWYHRAHGSCAAGIRSCGSLLQTTAGCFLEETRSYSSESPSTFSLLPCVHRWACLQSLIVRCFAFSFHVTFVLAFPLLLFLDVLTIRVSSSSSLIRASPAVLRMWNISHVQVLVTYFFCNHTHKTETGTANMWEVTNSNPSGPIKLSRQSETGSIQ